MAPRGPGNSSLRWCRLRRPQRRYRVPLSGTPLRASTRLPRCEVRNRLLCCRSQRLGCGHRAEPALLKGVRWCPLQRRSRQQRDSSRRREWHPYTLKTGWRFKGATAAVPRLAPCKPLSAFSRSVCSSPTAAPTRTDRRAPLLGTGTPCRSTSFDTNSDFAVYIRTNSSSIKKPARSPLHRCWLGAGDGPGLLTAGAGVRKD